MSTYQPGAPVEFGPAHSRAGQAGHVTKIKGPRTVQVEMESGFMLWNVKVTDLIPATRPVSASAYDPFACFGDA